MASVEEYVQLNIPETVAALTDTAKGNMPDAVAQSTERVLSALGIADEDSLDALGAKAEFAKGYVADLVTRLLIPPGIDYWQVQGQLNDTTTLPAGFTPGGGETSTYYNRVRGLEELDQILAGRIAANAQAFAVLLDADDVPVATFGVSTKRVMTQDPKYAFDRVEGCLRFVGRFGVAYPVIYTPT